MVLCASLEHPGNILPSLRKWYRTLEEQIKETYSEKEIEQSRQARKKIFFIIILSEYRKFAEF